MSEYQYYEFQALDRRLTEAAIKELSALSSRAKITATSASFTYSYGDFRGEPETILSRYFDVMLYMANWGTRRLMFRFPKALVNSAALRRYSVAASITIETGSEYLILDIRIDKQESEWIATGEGQLTAMIALRAAILEGDYRALYLAWLRLCQLQLDPGEAGANIGADTGFDEDYADDDYERQEDDEISPGTQEPAVPPNLRNLDGALAAFVEFIELDPLWIEVAATESASTSKRDEPIELWISALSAADSKKLLLRAAQGEPNIERVIKNELRKQFATSSPESLTDTSRTAGQIADLVQQKRRRVAEQERLQQEQDRVRRVKALAAREAAAWNDVTRSIEQRNAKGYDDAVSQLRELRELAEYRGDQESFKQRVNEIATQFSRLSSLRSKLIAERLI